MDIKRVAFETRAVPSKRPARASQAQSSVGVAARCCSRTGKRSARAASVATRSRRSLIAFSVSALASQPASAADARRADARARRSQSIDIEPQASRRFWRGRAATRSRAVRRKPNGKRRRHIARRRARRPRKSEAPASPTANAPLTSSARTTCAAPCRRAKRFISTRARSSPPPHATWASRRKYSRKHESKACQLVDSVWRLTAKSASIMFLGKVVGTVWSTKKTPDLEGVRFLIVHPY